ncbi:MAG TPA: hypothetical protein VF517_14265 [Thermoleophilaceae bacterium]|jgi:hypothetical protein
MELSGGTDLRRLRSLKDQHKAELLALPNVIGVGLGQRVIAGTRTEEWVISVNVVRKLAPDELDRDARIPAELDAEIRGTHVTAKTDVVESGVPRLEGYKDRIRPVQPGYSIRPYESNYLGTTGGFVVVEGDGYLMSNFHVLWDYLPGSPIVQPGDTSDPTDVIGNPDTRHYVQPSPDKVNYMDAALATLKEIDGNYRHIQPAHPEFGPLAGSYNSVGMGWHMRKVGATTGLTEARVSKWDFGGGFDSNHDGVADVWFEHQVELWNASAMPSDGGDSGAWWVTDDNRVGLLHWAGNGVDLSVATPISWVLQKFGASVWAKWGRDRELITGDAQPADGPSLDDLYDPDELEHIIHSKEADRPAAPAMGGVAAASTDA